MEPHSFFFLIFMEVVLKPYTPINSPLLIPYIYQNLYFLPVIQELSTLLCPFGPHHPLHHNIDIEKHESNLIQFAIFS